MSNSNTWKEKYLSALDEQEMLEKRVSAQADLLKRVVSQLSALASGQDPKIDAALLILKDKLRGASEAAVHDHMMVVEALARGEDERRRDQHAGFAEALTTLVSNLDTLRLPSNIHDQLKEIKALLAREIQDYSVYLGLLQSVNQCHQQALQAAAAPDQSLWERLSGKKRLQGDATEDSIKPRTASRRSEPQDAAVEPEHSSPSLSISSQAALSEQLDDPTFDEQRENICEALKEVLHSILPGETVKSRYHSTQVRLEKSLDWQQIVETIKDVRDILLGSSYGREEAFSAYLLSVNQQLQEICAALGVTIDHSAQQLAITDAFGQAVSDQMAWMQDAMASSVGLDQLKDDVSKHLHVIGNALQRFRQEQAAVQPLSEQLNTLLERMKAVEQESIDTKVLLEQERHKATHDALTELPNRQAYDDRANQEWLRFKRYGHPLSLAVCDVDHFKKFNDKYGHQTGDRVLKLVAKTLQKELREVDFVARYGGEEFVIVLPETGAQNALAAVEKTRLRIANASFRFKNKPVQITLSFGVTEFTREDTLESAFHRADQALYAAKQAGRNRAQLDT